MGFQELLGYYYKYYSCTAGKVDDKECFWARIYERLKSYGESETMLERPVTIYNATLKDTSSWANLFMDRDHSAPAKPDASTKTEP